MGDGGERQRKSRRHDGNTGMRCVCVRVSIERGIMPTAIGDRLPPPPHKYAAASLLWPLRQHTHAPHLRLDEQGGDLRAALLHCDVKRSLFISISILAHLIHVSLGMREKEGGRGNGQGGDKRKVGTRRQHRGEYVCVRVSIYVEGFKGSLSLAVTPT